MARPKTRKVTQRIRSEIHSAEQSPSPARSGAPPVADEAPPVMVTIPQEHYKVLLNQVAHLRREVAGLHEKMGDEPSHPATSRISRRSPIPERPARKSPRPSPPRRQSSRHLSPNGLSSQHTLHHKSAEKLPSGIARSKSEGKRPRPPSDSSANSTPEPCRRRGKSPEDEVARRFRQMEARVAEIAELQKNKEAEPYDPRPPFVPDIVQELVPRHFRIPQVDSYDGTSDPLDHLASYKAHMMVQGASDALHCKAFPATLRKTARMWFAGIKPGTISSFSQLEKLFLSHFRTSRQAPKSSDSLFLLRQKSDEPLKDYLARFNAVATEVPDLNEPIAMSAFKMGLRPSRLTFALDKNTPADYAGLLSKAHKYALAEEQAACRRQTEGKHPSEKKKKASDPRPLDGPPNGRRSPRPRAPPARRDLYTPLTASRERILMEIEKDQVLRPPRPMKADRGKRDRNKYCRFHHDYGHNTEDCFQLKEAIEELIKAGQLN